MQPQRWRRYVALGDSFTEGLCDDLLADGRHRGWADLLAMELADRAAAAGDTGIQYANLAVRGRVVRQVVAEQVPAAIALQPDLASLAVGVNDTLRRHFDLDAAATELESGVRRLRAAGIDVLLFAFGNPSRRSRVLATVKERIHGLNTAVDAIAAVYDCRVVHYWDVAVMDDDRYWAEDRLHLSPPGHRLASASAMEALGLGGAEWRTPPAPLPLPSSAARALGHARWVRAHAAPWVQRRLAGASSGDGITPKHPEWVWIDGGGHDA